MLSSLPYRECLCVKAGEAVARACPRAFFLLWVLLEWPLLNIASFSKLFIL